MSLLLDTTLRISLIVLIALSAAVALRRRSAALRHWVLATGIACAAVLPVFQGALPSWHIDTGGYRGAAPADEQSSGIASAFVVRSGAASESQAPTAPSAERQSLLPISMVLLVVWVAGALFYSASLLAGLARLARFASAARRVEAGRLAEIAAEVRRALNVQRSVTLLQGTDRTLLVTWGAARPKVLLPSDAAEWPDERARVVLQHEFAHIARGDWLAQMLAEALRAVYWFNPLLWIACRRLRHESERACDDSVLSAGFEPANYASHLLELACNAAGRRTRPALAMARPSSLEGRVSAMLNARTTRSPLKRAARLATLVAFAAVTVPIATAQARGWTFGGTVVDQTSRQVPDAKLVLTNESTGEKHETVTGPTGHFELPGLPSGEYRLEVQRPGFKTFVETVSVSDKDLSRNIHLQIGSVQETVTVTGPAATAQAEPDSQRGREQSRRRAQEMRERAARECSGGATAGGVGGEILPPVKLAHTRPEYPETLKAAGIDGVVILDALIGLDGTVREVTAVSSPHIGLERAAMDAVQRWQFSTTYLNCVPVEVPMRVTFKFVAP